MKQVIFLNSHPIQYFAPLYQKITNETDVDLEVIYCSDANLKGTKKDEGFGKNIQWDIPLLSGYKSVFLKNYSFPPFNKSSGFLSIINWGIIRYLYRKPSSIIIVHGWKYFTFVFTIIMAKLIGHTVVLRGETPLNQERMKNGFITTFKHVYLKFLFLFTDKVLYIGKQNRMFYEFLGIRPANLLFAPYSVDNARFRAQAQSISSEEAKSKLDLPGSSSIILYSGKYISKKRPMDLLQAFKNLSHPNAILVMVGEGELRPQMEAYIAINNLKNRVLLTGFINQSVIPLYYRAADVFVMCSGLGETWGLSVNEAMNFGLPVIVSDTCGSAYDLIAEGLNGRMFETGNVLQLSQVLQEFIEKNELEKAKIASTSLSIIDEYSYSQIIASLQLLSQQT